MSDESTFPLSVVDGLTLSPEYRKALRPGEMWADAAGRQRQLPRYFYEVPSWDMAMKAQLTPNFLLWEFIQVDVRETPLLLSFPRYVPCAITLLAVCLERFREAVGSLVHISANGGYRSPSHRLSRNASLHCWGVAANIYRIGDTYLDTRSSIERFSLTARETLPAVWTRPYGSPAGFAEDHLHLDLGYVTSIPRDVRS
ncbi:MAG: hypothetical protein H0W63_03240 [Gemmatimonadaceae bacterium]|nr:hypothetical protein [Gemmatimonadaceae bacterium]